MSGHSALGAQLRSLRTAADVTIESLAAMSGVSDRTISDIERGVSAAPQHRTLVAIASALGLHADAREALFATARAARSARRTATGNALATTTPARRADEFTGRERELATALRFLSATTAIAAPTLVISGGPGVGKTAMAVELLGRATGRPTTLVADLNGFGVPTAPTQLLQELLRQLPGGHERMPTTLDDAARRWKWLTARNPPLVLLDNAANEAQVRPVLSLNPHGAVVVTSRRSLAGLEGVSRITLGPLDREASIRLLERLIPSAQRDPLDTVALAELAEGMPLALRLAADAITSDPGHRAAELVASLRSADDRLNGFVAGDDSVAASIALSYDELPAPTAELWRDVSAIDLESFDARLAASVTAGPASAVDVWTVENRLDELADQGLLEARGGDRYRLSGLLRLFALARLREYGGEGGVTDRRRRVAEWLLANEGVDP